MESNYSLADIAAAQAAQTGITDLAVTGEHGSFYS